jgi:hypothetical protein
VIRKGPVFTRHIGFRVREETFSRIEELADSDGKLVNEWCRDMLLRTIDQRTDSLALHALLAEIASSRDIIIRLLFAFASDGRLPEQKVRDIIAQTEKHKYESAARLFEKAQAAQARRNTVSTERNVS